MAKVKGSLSLVSLFVQFVLGSRARASCLQVSVSTNIRLLSTKSASAELCCC